MAKSYDHTKIEAKWQKVWAKNRTYQAVDDPSKPKYYYLVEFPYPSGDGLHVGHVRSYTALDVLARKRRAEGYNVLYPIGWDAFGLPTENFAIKTGIHPAVVTKQNTDNFRRQLRSLGFSFDWSREINTTDPNYYQWTQWIFLQLFKKGLAYKKKMPINWCPKDKIGLANEEVIDGKCERCGTAVETREKEQWMLAITKYADRLDKDLDTVDYLPQIKTQQRNWIGRKEGALIKFGDIEVFTTRPETVFGATFIAVAGKEDKFTGNYVVNPANQEKIPVWEAEYVMGEVGTGAVMGVPAHDESDWIFAKKYNLPIKSVILPKDVRQWDSQGRLIGENDPRHVTGDSFSESLKAAPMLSGGILINSGPFSGSDSEQIRTQITAHVRGVITTHYKLRDWVFSRQRYWGEPIPMVWCEKPARTDGSPGGCGWVPVPEKDLPVVLPDVEKYQPTDTGESPLAAIADWVKTTCPQCGGPAKRETDTMPNWAGSSWYYLRYTDPHNTEALAGPEQLQYWTPVDWYNGGMEHTTLHLLYSRFWHKFLYDLGVVPTVEPYAKRTSHGLILAEGGAKMSKSKGNVVNPDEVVARYGADTLRVYEMFMGPFEQAIAWSTESIIGPRRFLEKVWRLVQRVDMGVANEPNQALARAVDETVQKVSSDIEAMRFNTAVSTIMILVGKLEKAEKISQITARTLLILLAPFAPHICEELWHTVLGEKGSVTQATWPIVTPAGEATRYPQTIVVQVNGVVRGSVVINKITPQADLEIMAKNNDKIKKWLDGKVINKTIYVKDRLLNFVV